MTAPRKIVDVPPNYTEFALRTRVEGTVIVEATVDERGNVIRSAGHQVDRPARRGGAGGGAPVEVHGSSTER